MKNSLLKIIVLIKITQYNSYAFQRNLYSGVGKGSAFNCELTVLLAVDLKFTV